MINPLLFLSETLGSPPLAEPPQMSGPPSANSIAPLPAANPGSGTPVNYDRIDIDFSAPQTGKEFPVRGNLFVLIYGTSAGGTVPILWVTPILNGNALGKEIPVTPGVSIRGIDFDKVRLRWVTTGTEIGYLVVMYNRQVEDLETM